jgi:hypothetical protein
VWELLNALLQNAIPSVAGAGLKALLGGLGGGQPGPGGAPAMVAAGASPGVAAGGSAAPRSMNFQGGFTGGPPVPTSPSGGIEGVSGFSTLGRSLTPARPNPAPTRSTV